ncbi:MAG: hypothetical protein IJX10_02540 [Phascolarctobacterium sp.]|nr:hypothetical protein [Phascolarctobacterium sp.]
MNSERGNISIIFLVVGLFLMVVAHLVMMYVGRDVELEKDYWRGRQLRLLCATAIQRFAQEEQLEAGESVLFEAALQPGNVPVQLSRNVYYSDDGYFKQLELSAATEEDHHTLRHLQFRLDEEKLLQAQGAMLISGKGLLGAEFLADEGIYTSAEEVTIPPLGFLKNTGTAKRSVSSLGMDDVKQYGLDKRFYYLTVTTNPTTFSKNMKVYGTAVIATEGSIIIESGCQFFDRVIFLVRGTLTIKDNVQLPQALVLSYGKVSIGAGCKIAGVIFSGGNIELGGVSELTHDESVVAPFSSAFYIL